MHEMGTQRGGGTTAMQTESVVSTNSNEAATRQEEEHTVSPLASNNKILPELSLPKNDNNILLVASAADTSTSTNDGSIRE